MAGALVRYVQVYSPQGVLSSLQHLIINYRERLHVTKFYIDMLFAN